VIATLLGWELGAGFTRDPVAEGALLTLELAGCIARLDPVGDFAAGVGAGGVLGCLGWMSARPGPRRERGRMKKHTMVARDLVLVCDANGFRDVGLKCATLDSFLGLCSEKTWGLKGRVMLVGSDLGNSGERLSASGRAPLLNKLMGRCYRAMSVLHAR
jgi:hypothetical protein